MRVGGGEGDCVGEGRVRRGVLRCGGVGTEALGVLSAWGEKGVGCEVDNVAFEEGRDRGVFLAGLGPFGGVEN